MRIRINRPELMHDLIAALCGGDCACEPVDEGTLAVTHRTAEDEREARIELTFFLRVWAARHPTVSAELFA